MSRSGLGPRRLPLFWKVLTPFLALIIILGVGGAFLIVRNLASGAQSRLDQDLARQSLDARSLAHDRELYLLESVNFASNIQGISDAIRSNDAASVARLLGSVLALKTDLNLLVAADARGGALVDYRKVSGTSRPSRRSGGAWNGESFVRDALADPAGNKHAGIATVGSEAMLIIAAPVCAPGPPCHSIGVAIVGIAIQRIAAEAAGIEGTGASVERGRSAVEIYDTNGRRLGAAGFPVAGALPARKPPVVSMGGELARSSDRVRGIATATLYAPFVVQGRAVGVLAVSIPRDLAFASVHGAAWRLALILLAAMAGGIGFGVLLSRRILRQVRPLVETNRALGRGDLTARAPVISDDELGELARGVNQMAEQLQASYETLELRVAQRTEEVRRLLSERTEFFAGMSHDFRTPLAVILSEAELLVDPTYPRKPEAIADAGRTIKESGAQVLALVNDVLELARAEAGRLEMSLDILKLADVIRDLRGTMEGLARAGDLTLRIDVPSDLPTLRADGRRLREVMLNLVDNAVKYTPPGGSVSLSAAASDGEIEIVVTDTGVGIPAEAGRKIFEPFYRVKGTQPARGQASTGLGLALTKRLVEAHHGHITFTSEPGAGTTFRVTLPMAGGSPKPRRARAKAGAGRA